MTDFFKQPENIKEQPLEEKTEKQLLAGMLKKTTGIYNILLFFLWVFIIWGFLWTVLYFAIPK
jgi:hypothetical protein